MPTTRQRYTVTETDELALALEAAARRWPQDAHSRSRLLLRLIEAGSEAIGEQRDRRRRRREVAVNRTHGQFRGVYGPGYLDRLRDEWPT